MGEFKPMTPDELRAVEPDPVAPNVLLVRVILTALHYESKVADLEKKVAAVTVERDAILQQARAWAMEAKAQRGTVNAVGALLGGMADWQDIPGAIALALDAPTTTSGGEK